MIILRFLRRINRARYLELAARGFRPGPARPLRRRLSRCRAQQQLLPLAPARGVQQLAGQIAGRLPAVGQGTSRSDPCPQAVRAGGMAAAHRGVGDKRAVLLVQLPPSLRRDDARLAYFLRLVPDWMRVAVEFRHRSWHCEEIFAALEAHRAGYHPTEDRGPVRIRWPGRYSQNARSGFGRKGCQPAGAGLAPVPLEYSIVSLTRIIASRINVVMVCLPGAAQDRLPASSPATEPRCPGVPRGPGEACSAADTPVRERGAAPPRRPGALRAGRPGVARCAGPAHTRTRWSDAFPVTPATLLA